MPGIAGNPISVAATSVEPNTGAIVGGGAMCSTAHAAYDHYRPGAAARESDTDPVALDTRDRGETFQLPKSMTISRPGRLHWPPADWAQPIGATPISGACSQKANAAQVIAPTTTVKAVIAARAGAAGATL